jgi:hypothetical protein
MSKPRPLTKRQRQMLRDAYEHLMEQGGKDKIRKFVSLYRPCPRIGDLRVLNGLTLRGLMTDGDHLYTDGSYSAEIWPRWIAITAAGVAEWERTRFQHLPLAAPTICTACQGPIDENGECRCEECRTCLGAGRVRDGETRDLRKCLDCNGAGMHITGPGRL